MMQILIAKLTTYTVSRNGSKIKNVVAMAPILIVSLSPEQCIMIYIVLCMERLYHPTPTLDLPVSLCPRATCCSSFSFNFPVSLNVSSSVPLLLSSEFMSCIYKLNKVLFRTL